MMANPDQKTILLERATYMEVKTLLRELARVWEKDIDEDYDIDCEV